MLLKNKGGVLPLSRKSGRDIVVGGKTADNLGYQMGGWSISWQGSGGDITEGTTFWEAIQQETEGTRTDVEFVGTDRMWDELVRAHTWWDRHGRPPVTDFGLTVSAEGTHRVWPGSPDGPAWCVSGFS